MADERRDARVALGIQENEPGCGLTRFRQKTTDVLADAFGDLALHLTRMCTMN